MSFRVLVEPSAKLDLKAAFDWYEAKAIIREIELRADIWLADINTGNIKFEGY